MTTCTTESPDVSRRARQLAVQPYVERLRAWCEEHATEGDTTSFELRAGDRVLTFEPPEFALIHHSSLVATESGQEGARFPAEVAGLVLKSCEDLACLREPKGSSSISVQELQRELMRDGALGSALLTEIKAHTDRLEALGRVEQARVLGKFTRLVWNLVAEVEQHVVASEHERDRALTECLTDRRPASPPAASAPQAAPSPIQDLRLPTEMLSGIDVPERSVPANGEHASPPGPSLTLALSVGLLVATLIWFGLVGPFRPGGSTAPVLELGDFEGLLTGIEARPPSLYGSVDRAGWERLDSGARLQLVERVSLVLSANGYTGALLRTEEGIPVAQWLQDRGSRVLENHEAE